MILSWVDNEKYVIKFNKDKYSNIFLSICEGMIIFNLYIYWVAYINSSHSILICSLPENPL